MANVSRKRGFLPYGEAGRLSPYNAGGTIYPGDAVKLNSSGLVVAASAGDALLGAAANYALSGGTVNVWDDPEQQFTCQVATGTSVAQTNAGNNADILATTGDTTYKHSKQELDGSTFATTSTLVMRCLAIDPAIDNAAGDVCKVIVSINVHQRRAGVTGV